MRNPLLAAALTCGLAQAADAIPYADLTRRLTPFGTTIKDRSIAVVTTDGVKHKGHELRVGADGVRLFKPKSAGAFYAKESIARIEIAPGPRKFRKIGSDVKHIGESVAVVCESWDDSEKKEPVTCIILGPIAFGITTARAGINAPFYFLGGVADALARAEVYKIAP